MPILQIEILKGRTVEQKRMLVDKVSQAVSESIDCSKEAVKIIIRDMEFEDFAVGGVLKCDEKK